MTLIQSLPIIVSLTSVLISLLLYRLGLKSLKDNHDYNRRQCALKLIQDWDKDTIKARRCIVNKWKDSYHAKKIIDYKQIEKYNNEQKALYASLGNVTNDSLTVTDQIQIIFNYFENLALAIEHNIADETVIKQAFYSTFQRWYLILTDYREHVNRERDFHPWKALEIFHDEWYKTADTPIHEKRLPPTGHTPNKPKK